MKKILLSLCLTFCSTALFAQIKGAVTSVDQKPMSGIVVSDGKQCVVTNSQGQFTLEANPDARFVFVTKPAGWRTTGRHYVKVAPDKQYNFTLEKSPNEQNNVFSFVQVTDAETFMNKRWVDNVRDWVQTNPTAFIINTGDICYERGIKTNGTQIRAEHMGTDVFYCVGNHDLVAGEYGEKMFEDYFGPAYYSFDAGNVHFMVLPMLGGDHSPSYNKAQLMAWMRADLAFKNPETKVVMFNHDLWFTGDDLKIKSGDDVLDMSEHQLVSFLYGHWHSHYAKQVAGIKTFSGSAPDKGGIDHGPSVFRVLDVDAQGNISSSSRYTYIEGALSSVAPANGDCLAAGEVPIVVNTYRTASPTLKVSAMVGGKKISLEQTSDWNWRGSVALKNGSHRLHLEATFADGTILVDNTDFTVGEKPTVEWVSSVGSNIWMVQPVVASGRVFTATIDDDNNEQCYVLALDETSGSELWRAKTDNSLKNTIVSDGERVVACDSDGKLYCFAAKDGKLIWKVRLSKGLLPHTLQGIALENGVIYAGQGNGFSAVKLRDGAILWTNSEWGGGEGTTSTIVVGGDVVLASAHWNGLFAHDKNTGKLLWKKQDSKVRFRDGSATYYDGSFYLATSNQLMQIEPRSGEVLRSLECDVDFSVAAAPIVTSDAIYCATSDRGVAAFDRSTFKQLWGYNSSPAMFYSVPYAQDFQCSVECSPVLRDGVLIFGGSDGYLYGVNVADGTTAFKRRVGSPIFSTPTLVGELMYVSDFGGSVMKLVLNL